MGIDNEYGVPEWNFIVLPNFFEDDDYWTSSLQDACGEAYLAIANLGNKYRNPREWIKACKIYDANIGVIIDYYGGKSAVAAYKKETGQYPDGIRLRPKLDKCKENKIFRETGLLPPESNLTMQYKDDIVDIAHKTSGVTMSDAEEMDLHIKKAKGIMADALLRSKREMESNDRIRNIYNTSDSLSLDIIANYFAQKDSGVNPNINKRDDRSLDEMVDDYNRSLDKDEWESVYGGGSSIMKRGATLYTTKQLTRLEVAKIMAANGLPAINELARKRASDDDIRNLKRELGESIMTKKQRKKAEKQYKRYAQQRERAAKSDRDLARSLTNTKLHVNNSMRLSDIIGRGK